MKTLIMHIPDGFLDAKTVVVTGVLAAAGLGTAIRKMRFESAPRRVPVIGLSSAFIFAVQMLNFPVAGGTSGHLIGVVLAVVLIGSWAATVAIASVLILQCFLFADGGVTALGANIFNMAVLAPAVGYAVYFPLRRLFSGTRGMLFAAAFAAWVSVVAASIACAGELAVSGTVAWKVAFPAMAGVHMLIGLGEAAITALVLAAVARLRPELMREEAPAAGYGAVAIQGLLVALGLAIFVAPFACAWPDGLERVAARLGLESAAASAWIVSPPMRDYAFPGLRRIGLSTAAAGAAGTLAAFGLSYLLARALTKRK
jgi:cobalt/nickel transport system permease protein